MFIDLIQKQTEQNKDLSSVEIAVCGGASCAPSLFKEMLSKLKVKRVKVKKVIQIILENSKIFIVVNIWINRMYFCNISIFN